MKHEFLRVTEIISPFTGVEFVPYEILEKAGSRGTQVHELIQDKLDPYGIQEIPISLVGYMNSFNKFYIENDFSKSEIIQEKRFNCEKLFITGQIDFIIKSENGNFIFDWKTSSRESISWKLQGAAYRYLCEENGIKINNTTFVKLDKKGGKPKLFTYDTYEEDLEYFFKCLELYRYFDMKNTRRVCG